MANGKTPPSRRPYAVSLGPWGWITVLSKAACITFILLLKAVRAALGGSRNGLDLYDYVAYQAMRDYQTGLDAVGIQNLLPCTATICRWYARRRGMEHATICLDDGTSAVRMGPGAAPSVVVLFHGGAYMASVLPDHLHFALGFADAPPKDTRVYVLQYDVASEKANHYPRQLQQAVSLLDHLVNVEDIQPSAMTLLGDSAGAHLLLSLLLHLCHQNPHVPALAINGRFRAAALISPWIINTAGPPSASMAANHDKDIITAGALAYWARNFLGSAPPDAWNSLLTAPASWWADLPVEDVLVTYGQDEVLRDDAARFCEALRAATPNAAMTTTTREFPGELHEHMMINRFLRINKPCASEQVYRAWLEEGSRRTAKVGENA